jgi:DNA invertase Pin-like site-specific DNA recombinase
MPSTNGHGPKRAILYARVSTDEQAHSGYSLAQQIEALREYAAREGYEVLEGVEDPGQGGASLARPGLDKVRDLVAKGGVSIVLAQDRDRFAREPAYLYLLREEFAEKGTRLKALSDRGDDSPEGQLTDGILDQLAKFERTKTAERTRRDRLRKAREGKVIAGRQADYGFRYNAARDGYTVHEGETRVVRRIFRMIADGSSVNGARMALEAAKVSPPRGYIGSAPLYASAYSTTCTSRTPLRRWLSLSRLRWRHAWTQSGPMASVGTTAAMRSARTSSMRIPSASSATSPARAMSRSRARSGSPCQFPTLAFPKRTWSAHAVLSGTMRNARRPGGATGSSPVASSAVPSAAEHSWL